MNDLISRQAAIEALGERPLVWTDDDQYTLGERNQYDIDRLAIETLPSAEVTLCYLGSPCEYQNADIAMPSAERAGKWIEVENKWGGLEIRCSECGAQVPRDGWGNAMQCDYCPNCGARMMEGEEG